MGPPARSVESSSFMALGWLPCLGIVLAAIGALLIGAGLRDGASPTVAAGRAQPPTHAGAVIPNLIVPVGLLHVEGSWLSVEEWRGPRRGNPAVRAWSDQASSCQHAGCPQVLRAESPQVENLRDAVTAMATAQHRGRWTDACPWPMIQGACQRPGLATSDDRIANALFGHGHSHPADSAGATDTPVRDAPDRSIEKTGLGRAEHGNAPG
jgi:hypothetical protein